MLAKLDRDQFSDFMSLCVGSYVDDLKDNDFSISDVSVCIVLNSDSSSVSFLATAEHEDGRVTEHQRDVFLVRGCRGDLGFFIERFQK